ncbi:MAG TPA: hypothetical protein VFQ25_15650 [Ktedonobacterales bacterium]|nr:hypothetical protein [Ktedonobacterales bacterium]
MSLHFELGDADQPRGHAILYARLAGGGVRYVATYCVILPISFSIGKFLPPILGGQIPMEELGEAGSASPMPIPPMLEDVESVASLRMLAERRGDDLCDLGVLLITDDTQRLAFAAEAAAEYGRAYATYAARWPSEPAPAASEPIPLTDADARDMVASLLPERDRLGDLARLIGQSRYAMEVHDQRQLDEVGAQMRRLAATLPEKYRADQLVAAALRSDAEGAQLAELYLQRAYKLLDEDYISIPPIEQRIRELRGPDAAGGL